MCITNDTGYEWFLFLHTVFLYRVGPKLSSLQAVRICEESVLWPMHGSQDGVYSRALYMQSVPGQAGSATTNGCSLRVVPLPSIFGASIPILEYRADSPYFYSKYNLYSRFYSVDWTMGKD